MEVGGTLDGSLRLYSRAGQSSTTKTLKKKRSIGFDETAAAEDSSSEYRYFSKEFPQHRVRGQGKLFANPEACKQYFMNFSAKEKGRSGMQRYRKNSEIV